jgi:ATP-dependent Zn protease
MVDKKVQEILKESKARVTELLLSKDKEMRRVARNLYKHDYLDEKELDLLMSG